MNEAGPKVRSENFLKTTLLLKPLCSSIFNFEHFPPETCTQTSSTIDYNITSSYQNNNQLQNAYVCFVYSLLEHSIQRTAAAYRHNLEVTTLTITSDL